MFRGTVAILAAAALIAACIPSCISLAASILAWLNILIKSVTDSRDKTAIHSRMKTIIVSHLKSATIRAPNPPPLQNEFPSYFPFGFCN